MKVELVIARYNENLEWLERVPKHIQITIYNKGKDDIPYAYIPLPNVGRESHTYLYHIINNYENLADRTIFCQGDTLFHSPKFIELLENADLFEEMQPLSAYYWKEGEAPYYLSNPPLPVLNATRDLWIENCPVHVEYMDNNFTTRYPYLYFEHYFLKMNEWLQSEYKIDNVFKFWVDRFNISKIDIAELFPACYAGIFSVDKRVILDNHVDFYNNIMNTILYDIRIMPNGKQFDCGLYLEKLWLVIFNYKKYNLKYKQEFIAEHTHYNRQLKIESSKHDGYTAHFSIFNIVSQIYLELNINNKMFRVYLFEENGILVKIGKQVIFKRDHLAAKYNNPVSVAYYERDATEDSTENGKITYLREVDIFIQLLGNTLSVYLDGGNREKPLFFVKLKKELFDESRGGKHLRLISAEIFTLTDENNFHDLLEEKKETRKQREYTLKRNYYSKSAKNNTLKQIIR